MNQKKARKTWKEMYELAHNYYNYYGNLEVKKVFKTVDGINKDENGVELGIWIQTQRRLKKGKERYKITEEQIYKLDQIGMIWDCYEEKWNRMYELAKNYYNYYRNLEIRKGFKTVDGIKRAEKGLALGEWIQVQRQARKRQSNVKITEERIQKLDQIGMIWDIKKNNLEIIRLCKQYRIDLNKNKRVQKKSYNEFYAKICYLNENNIPICNADGSVHKIFFMADINIQAQYGVSLQNLIQKYINEKAMNIQIVLK